MTEYSDWNLGNYRYRNLPTDGNRHIQRQAAIYGYVEAIKGYTIRSEKFIHITGLINKK